MQKSLRYPTLCVLKNLSHSFRCAIVIIVLLQGFINAVQAQYTIINIPARGYAGSAEKKTFTVPPGGPYKFTITLVGGSGGSNACRSSAGAVNALGGKGAKVTASFYLESGWILQASAGANGQNGDPGDKGYPSNCFDFAGGGGGASGINISNISPDGIAPLIIAGGGGGGGSNKKNGNDAPNGTFPTTASRDQGLGGKGDGGSNNTYVWDGGGGGGLIGSGLNNGGTTEGITFTAPGGGGFNFGGGGSAGSGGVGITGRGGGGFAGGGSASQALGGGGGGGGGFMGGNGGGHSFLFSNAQGRGGEGGTSFISTLALSGSISFGVDGGGASVLITSELPLLRYSNRGRLIPVSLPDCLVPSYNQLEALYDSTGGDNWTDKTNWLTSGDMSTWFGVILTPEKCFVSQLNLDNNNLVGTIPNLNLPNMVILNLSNNKLTGAIPTFNNSTNLIQLFLSNNQLTGSVPNFNFPNFSILKLDGNKLTGAIPNFSGVNLTTIDLGSNQLTGTIPNFNLPKLTYLSLYNNKLTGSIPTFNLPALVTLGVGSNQLSGDIPNFNSLSGILELSNNKFIFGDMVGKSWLSSGVMSYAPQKNIPIIQTDTFISVNTGIANGDNSQTFYWYRIGANNNASSLEATTKVNKYRPFTGGKYMCQVIHNVLTIASDPLRNLFLQSDTINFIDNTRSPAGRIYPVGMPDFWKDDFKELEKLYDATGGNNWLNKTNWFTSLDLRTWAGVLMTPLPSYDVAVINLTANNLTGTLPELNFPQLTNLLLQQNKLSGGIPIINAPKLTELDLNKNQLSGTLANINFPVLNYLDVSDNLFSGDIPNFNAGLTILYINYNNFGFTDMLGKSWLTGISAANVLYAPQKITTFNMSYSNGTLYAELTNPNYNYAWYKDGVLLTSAPNAASFTPTVNGTYTCTVTCKGITSTSSIGRNLFFKSNAVVARVTSNSGRVFPTFYNDAEKNTFNELEKLYNSTNGTNWISQSGWFIDPNFRNWFGISTNVANDVTSIILSSNNLVGSIANLNLPFLKNLALANNTLYGTIPNLIPNFTPLCTVNLQNNYFNFGDMIGNSWVGTNNGTVVYAPQKTVLTLVNTAGVLSVNTGISNGDNSQTFTWYRNGVAVATTNVNYYSPLFPGAYSCSVAHNVLTISSDASKNFYLTSTSLDVAIKSAAGRDLPVGLPDCLFDDFNELEKMYDAAGGANWTNKSNWLMNADLSTWYGVKLTADGCDVSSIVLNSNNLVGIIPALSFPYITQFSLYDNKLTGTIPNLSFPKIEIFGVGYNQLSGNIPNFSPTLTSLFVDGNKFIFGDMLGKTWLSLENVYYAPQAKITMSFKDGVLNANYTGVVNDGTSQRFYWYKDGALVESNNFSGMFTPTSNGTYRCEAYHFALNVYGIAPKRLALITNDITVNLYSNTGRPFPAGLKECLKDDFNELEKLYDATGGANWTNKSNWFTNPDLNTWFGITLTADGCDVAQIKIESNNLIGTIPNLSLPNLTYLSLYNNKLTGTIPNFSLPKLNTLGLGNNQLSGDIPNFTSPLSLLVLSNNKFIFGDMVGKAWLSSTIPYYTVIYALQAKIPIINSNQVLSVNTGIVPDGTTTQAFYLWRNGVYTGISNNTGVFRVNQNGTYRIEAAHSTLTVADNVYKNLFLVSDDIVLNNISNGGRIFPVGLSECLKDDFNELEKLYDAAGGANWTNKTNWLTNPDLKTWFGITLTADGCDVAQIKIESNNLIGTIPNFSLPNLTYLSLYDNKLTGTIPKFRLLKLNILGLGNNQLSGDIPNFISPLSLLVLNNNKFVFGDMVGKAWLSSAVPGYVLAYAPQAKIPITLTNGVLSVNTGIVPDGVTQTFYLSKNGVYSGKSNQTGTFTITENGTYRIEVAHYDLTKNGNPDKNLILVSQDIDFKPYSNAGRLFPSSMKECLIDDFNELEKLYDATGGANWIDKTNWFTNPDLSTWYGVKLTADGCDVASIVLNSNNLTGTIPAMSLPSITQFSLYDNKLTGTIPNLLFPKIEIFGVGYNQLSGNIPNFSPTLTSLFVDGNKFVFGDMLGKTWLSLQTLYYAPQSKITMSFNNGVLDANYTGVVNDGTSQIFYWYKDGVFVKSNYSGTLTPASSGTYRCEIVHSALLVYGITPKSLVLITNDLTVNLNSNTGRVFPVGLKECLKDDFNELEKLYDATGGANWTNKTNWFTNPDLNTWFGITLTADGCDVAQIKIENNNLIGTIPNLSLPNLTYLSLYNNKLTGTIPIFSLPKLNILGLGNNQLSGDIPNFTSTLSILVLNNNKFVFSDMVGKAWLSSSVPGYVVVYAPQAKIPIINSNQVLSVNTGIVPNGTTTQAFYLWRNSVYTGISNNTGAFRVTQDGTYRIEAAHSALTVAGNANKNLFLVSDDITVNNTSNGGRIFPVGLKDCLKDDFNELEKLYDATGGANWTNKTNWFTNPDLSTWLGITLTADGCDVAQIKIESNNLIGTIPNLSLPNLTYLSLYDNKLTGTIPNFSLPKLNILGLGSNQLSGDIPNFTSPLSTIVLSNNKFVFGDMVGKSWLNATTLVYAPQANIPITFSNCTLSVNTGTTDNAQTFRWYRDNVLVLTSNNNTFAPTVSGNYSCKISHNPITVAGDINKNLVLQSETQTGAYEVSTAGCPVFSGSAACQTFSVDGVSGNQWFNLYSGSGLVASINPNGSDLGTVSAQISNPGSAILNKGITYLGRTVNVTSSKYGDGATIPNTYSLRLYYNNAELSAYNTAANKNMSRSDLNIAWKSGGSGCDLVNYGGTSAGAMPKSSISSGDFGADKAGFYLQFGLNHFTIFSTTADLSVLPITLLSFSGENKNNENVLSWQTSAEHNSKHFEIERSTDGKTFGTVGKISAAGESSVVKNYTFADKNVSSPIYYYRLKSVDNDGSSEYSRVISIVSATVTASFLHAFPNPTDNSITISSSDYTQPARVYNYTGALVFEKNTTPQQIDMSDMPTGIYFLHVGNEVLKVVKN